MSSKKVKKYIKAQRKAQKQAQRDQQRAAARHAQGLPEQPPASPAVSEERAPSSPAPQRASSGSAGRGGRLAAVLAGLGLVAAAGGSAGLQFALEDTEQPLLQQSHMVPAPAVTERLSCPPVPGQPDSLSDDGLLQYQQRDDSAAISRDAAVFAASDGRLPAADWRLVDHDGPGEAEVFIEPDQTAEASETSLAERALITGEFEAGEDSALLEIQPVEGVSPAQDAAAAASFIYQADSGPVTGLAAGRCSTPQRSQWFLGPESGTGANSLLTLANPQSRDATVEVITFDAEGETGTLGSTTLLVPGNTVRSVNLAGLSEGESQLAVQVRSQGAPVAAHLQSALATGGTGQGLEQLDALPGPQQQHYALGVPAGDDEDPQLWFYAPGTEHVTVELQVFGPEGQLETGTPGVFSLEPGRVSVAGLHGLEPGTYDVVLSTDHPTLAAVRSTGDGQPVTVEVELEPETDPFTGLELEPETEEQETDPAADFSWSASAPPLAAGSGALLPTGYQPELRFLAPPAQEQVQVTYRLFDSEGRSTDDLVEEVDPGASAEIRGEDLEDYAGAAGLDDLYAVLILDVQGQAYGGTVTRDEEGRFTTGQLEPISPGGQHILLRIDS
ncbi:DUF5719 family protein [Nesterenkonia muleiensis]|uniref:DUF5719 family protein n=1 Tax=Nesterenkonia muleiensis TaxID=2282648 RepID=UPI00192E64F7|nr:DUF5719 family protein [Nesterenkonia muleiensis]